VLRLHGPIRSPGIGLFVAEQFLSDDCYRTFFGTKSYERTTAAEPAWRRYEFRPCVMAAATRLEKGRLIVNYDGR